MTPPPSAHDSGLTIADLTLICAAKAHVPEPMRRGGWQREVACNACRTATAVTPWPSRRCSRLGRRNEAGPHQLQRELNGAAPHAQFQVDLDVRYIYEMLPAPQGP